MSDTYAASARELIAELAGEADWQIGQSIGMQSICTYRTHTTPPTHRCTILSVRTSSQQIDPEAILVSILESLNRTDD